MAASPKEQMVEEWLRGYLSARFLILQSKIDRTQTLRSWGFVGEPGLAKLISHFNRYCRTKDLWQDVEVAPFDIIKDPLPDTVGAFIDALSQKIRPTVRITDPEFARLVTSQVELANRLQPPRTAQGIEDWLVGYVGGSATIDTQAVGHIIIPPKLMAMTFDQVFQPRQAIDPTKLGDFIVQSKPTLHKLADHMASFL